MRWLFFIGLIFWVSAGHGHETVPGNVQDPKLVKGQLDNGLTYYIYPNAHPKGEAVYRLFVKAGSAVETDRQRGLAHFLEHMAFNGTTHFPKDSMIRFLQAAGARFGKDLNAHTSYNETVYKLQLPTTDTALVARTIAILADWAGEMTLDSLEIEQERGVILAEWLSRKNGEEGVQEALLEKLLRNSRYAERKVIGDTAVIRHFEHQELHSFYASWYHPSLMAVAVAGDVDPDQVRRLIEQHFSRLRNGKAGKSRMYPIKDDKRPEYRVVSTASGRKAELMAIRLLDASAPVTDAAGYLAYLKEALSVRLVKRRLADLSFTAPPYRKASFGLSSFIHPKRVLMAGVEVNPEKVQESVQAFIQHMEQLSRYGFLEHEITSALKSYEAQLKRKATAGRPVASGSIMEEIYADFYRGQPMVTPDLEYKWFGQAVKQVDSMAMLREFRRLFVPEKSRYLFAGYPATDPVVSEGNILKDWLRTAQRAQVPLYRRNNTVAQALIAERPEGVKPTDTMSYLYWQATGFSLDNGVHVIFRHPAVADGKLTVSGFRKGGLYALDSSDYPTGLFAGNVVALSGAGDKSREELNDYLAGNSASVRFLIDKTRTGIAGSADRQDAETLLQLIILRWTEPNCHPDVFRLIRDKAAEQYRQTPRTPSSSFRDELAILVNGADYTTRALTDTMITEQVTEDRVLPVFNRAFGAAGGFTFIVTADTADHALRDRVLAYLGTLPAGTNDTAYRYHRTSPGGTVRQLVRDNGDVPKVAVSLIFQRADDASAGLWVPDTKLGMAADVLRMRLLRRLREELGGIYSVSVSASSARYPSPLVRFSIAFSCAPERARELIAETKATMENMAGKPEEWTEGLEAVKSNLLKEMELNRQKDSFWTTHIRQALFNRDTGDDITRYSEVVHAVTPEEMAGVVRHYLLDTPVIQAELYPEGTLATSVTTSVTP